MPYTYQAHIAQLLGAGQQQLPLYPALDVHSSGSEPCRHAIPTWILQYTHVQVCVFDPFQSLGHILYVAQANLRVHVLR